MPEYHRQAPWPHPGIAIEIRETLVRTLEGNGYILPNWDISQGNIQDMLGDSIYRWNKPRLREISGGRANVDLVLTEIANLLARPYITVITPGSHGRFADDKSVLLSHYKDVAEATGCNLSTMDRAYDLTRASEPSGWRKKKADSRPGVLSTWSRRGIPVHVAQITGILHWINQPDDDYYNPTAPMAHLRNFHRLEVS